MTVELKPCVKCAMLPHITDGHISGEYEVSHVCGEAIIRMRADRAPGWRNYDTAVRRWNAWNTRAAPKIRPLIWEYHPVGYMASDNIGCSYILDTRGARSHFIKWPQGHCPEVYGADEAKAAAQADYERRILSALE